MARQGAPYCSYCLNAVAPIGAVIVVHTLSLIVMAVAGGVCEWETCLAMPTSSRRRSLERVRRELVRVSHRGLDRVELVRALGEVLAPVVPFDGVCWHTADPATRLITSHYTNLDGSGFRFICANEYLQEDVAKFASLAGGRPPVAVLSAATGGMPERSARYREVYRPRGWGSELRASFDVDGATWGSAMFLREAARPDFTASEAAVVASVSRHVAHGLRAAMLRPAATQGRDEEGPGVIVIDGRDEIESITRPGERWLSEAQTIDVPTIGRLPSAVLAVAAQARPGASGGAPARARLQLRSGRWILLHAAALDDGAHGRVAVIVEPAGAHELAPLLVRAYGLTAREREVVAAVLRGLSTGEIAARLWLSPHTVQDHLKAIFDKTGARSRRELMARLFYDHLEPLIAADAEPGIDGLPHAREDPSTLG